MHYLISDLPTTVTLGPIAPINISYVAHDYIGLSMFNGLVVPIWADKRNLIMNTYVQPFNITCLADLQLCGTTTPYYKNEKASNTKMQDRFPFLE